MRLARTSIASLIAVCLVSGFIFWLFIKHQRDNSGAVRSPKPIPVNQPLSSDQLTLDSQALEKASDYSQRISDSILLIFGGSIAVLLGTGYRRPGSKRMRTTYLLFPAGWICLWLSVSAGLNVRGTYIGYLLTPPKDTATRFGRIQLLNAFALSQEKWLLRGLAIFAIWLMIYLLWWIFQADTGGDKEDAR